MNKSITENRLAESNSPYLLQHKKNPVRWYEWGEQAFKAAAEKDRLIFLSIGYSTCHWCHVMAHESFEDEEVAKILNENFISVKVDREERPDIDKIYMDVCQIMTGSGGWPLTIIMTADKTPIFAGTYFPKLSKYGRPGLIDILKIIDDKWKNQRKQIIDQAEKIAQAVAVENIPPEVSLVPQIGIAAAINISRSYDRRYGGFSSAPKFPMGHQLMFLARQAARNSDKELLAKVEHSFLAMYHGGLFDQVGFGFCRYSTDEKWMVPHFEKMLYDNALLIMAAVELYQLTWRPVFAEAVSRVFAYLQRDLTDGEGGFFSAEDADSEGHEGKFYVFSVEEFDEIAGSDALLMRRYFGVTDGGNFESMNHLNISVWPEEFCPREQLDLDSFLQKVENLRLKLLEARDKRVRPSLDDKILTAWNGLMINALADAGRILSRDDMIEAARRSADFILKNLRTCDGKLLRSWRKGKASINAFLEDYVFLTAGLLALYNACHQPEYLEAALSLHNQVLQNFAGAERGVFYETATGAEALPVRPYNQYDGAMPSSPAQLAINAIQIGHLTGISDHIEIASAIIERAGQLIKQASSGFTRHLTAFDLLVNPPANIVLFAGSHEAEEMIRAVNQHWLPGMSLVVIRNEAEKDAIESILPAVTEMKPEKMPEARVCEGFKCLAPVHDAKSLEKILSKQLFKTID
ncbi:MAG: thioredoxin domain-containing protein [Candidatus Rifleibacteriota bacterium]